MALNVAVRRTTMAMAARMAAARAEHERRTAAGFLAQTENGKRRVSRLNLSTNVQDETTRNREPVKNSRDEKPRDHLQRCKTRPDGNKERRSGVGGGAISKRFVPWC